MLDETQNDDLVTGTDAAAPADADAPEAEETAAPEEAPAADAQ